MSSPSKENNASARPALFVGRFQPFHRGHLDALLQILRKEKEIIIVIGSAEDDFLPENPFTAGERYQMIDGALREAKVERNRYAILPVRNIAHYGFWVKHVETLVPPFEHVYTGSPLVKTLFEDEGYTVRQPTFKVSVSGTEVRKAMLSGKDWKSLVSPSVVRFLTKLKAEKRLKNLSALGHGSST